jgi:2C-methyl-D-erythritol 2,4-cyclodiphosphate synthase
VIQHQYDYRSGIGTDIHRLVPERKLILGGIEIPFELGCWPQRW